ncbi:MAG: transporter substrate-binding domain-containing protein [Prevotellaceae bacterium]|jgi:membrane-bound lytic murein transglycosylase F|nr:transporter substrate-binding domain-containing protein [Prevotellaceae bacterium]
MKNKQSAIILLISILAALAIGFIKTRNAGRDLPRIVKSGYLQVVIDEGRMGYMLQQDSAFGLQYDLIKAFADSLGLELRIKKGKNAGKNINRLLRGNCDIAVGYIPITTEWSHEVAFSIPLTVSRQVLVQHAAPGKEIIKKQYDLAGDTVYLPKDSPYKMRIKNLSDEIGATIHFVEMKVKTLDRVVEMVAGGEIKQTVCSEQLAKKMLLENPAIDVSLLVGFEQQYCWALHRNSVLLLEKLNDFLEQMLETTEYWKMYRKYI